MEDETNPEPGHLFKRTFTDASEVCMSVSEGVKGLPGWPGAFLASVEQQATGALGLGELPVTPEMIAAGRYFLETRSYGENHNALVADFYRAMASHAPVELVSAGELVALKERDAAYKYLRTVFEICAPQCTPLPDLTGLCTQIDNLIAGYRITEEQIRAENARLVPDAAQAHMRNDELLDERHTFAARITELEAERTQFRADMREQLQQYQDVMDLVGRLDAEIAALRGEKFVPDAPKANPYREFGGDRRRIGG